MNCTAAQAGAALLLVAGCGEVADDGASRSVGGCERVVAGFNPELRETECRLPAVHQGHMTCGVLRVAEDPGVESCVLNIAWARYQPESVGIAGPPLFLLGGGPGSPLLQRMEEVVALGAAVAPGRELVVHDARGSGLSQPALDCLAIDAQATRKDPFAWERACAAELARQGHRPERYRTSVLATDVVTLADALAIPVIDLLGASYGSRLAHVVAVAHPNRVRAVVLDAATPLDTPLLERVAGNFRRAWQRVVDDCSAQTACAGAHGDIEAKLNTVFANLAAQPVQIETPSGEVEVGAELFASLLSGMMTSHTLLPTVPALVAAVAAGDMQALPAVIAAVSREPEAFYMHHAIMCSEELPHNDRASAVADLSLFPEVAYKLPYDLMRDTCDALGLVADANLDDTPPITLPTLALTGRYDVLSPASNWDHPKRRLPRGSLWEIGDAGHGARRTPCGKAVIAAFLKEPKAPRWPSCLAEVQAATFVTE